MAIHTDLEEDLRLQDVVARAARTNLKSTVRVLIALCAVLEELGHEDCADEIKETLEGTTIHDGVTGRLPLNIPPTVNNIEASDHVYERLLKQYGSDIVASYESSLQLASPERWVER